MHPSVLAWGGSVVANNGLAELSVLEVGSYNVNGSLRRFFRGPYIGVDMRDGPGVDKVMNANDLDFPDREFDVVVCTEMLEHDLRFWMSLSEMWRVLKRGGTLILSARGYGFPLHDYPSDYYRFTVDGMHRILSEEMTFRDVRVWADKPDTPGVLAVAVK